LINFANQIAKEEVFIMAKIDIKQMGLKIVQAVAYILGSALFSYNITAFKVEKHGSYYFLDKNQYWLAIGVALIVLGLLVRHWKKL